MHLPWRDVALPGGGPPIPTSLTEAETAELRRLAEGGSVLEIGAAYGYSTVALAQVAKHVVSIDPHTAHGSYGALMANLGTYRVAEKVRVMRAFSGDVLPVMVDWMDHFFDLVFIDGDHTAAGVRADLAAALRLVHRGGFIALHDVGETCCCPEVGPTVASMIQGYDMVDTMAVLTA